MSHPLDKDALYHCACGEWHHKREWLPTHRYCPKMSTNDMVKLCGWHLSRLGSGNPFVQRVMTSSGEELFRGTMQMIKKWLRTTGRVV